MKKEKERKEKGRKRERREEREKGTARNRKELKDWDGRTSLLCLCLIKMPLVRKRSRENPFSRPEQCRTPDPSPKRGCWEMRRGAGAF